MPGFGHNPFGHFPFGHFDWSRTVLYRMLPELHKRQDAEQGYPLAKWVEGERPSFETLRRKIQKFGDLRDPLVVRSQYNEIASLTLGKRVVTPGAVLQRGINGTLTAFGEFVSPSVRFNPTLAGKELVISRSSDPSHNQTVIVAQVDASTPTRAMISPPLGLDAGPLTWELREPAVEPTDRTLVELTFGDPSVIAPGWVLFDGFAEFEILARNQLEGRTEREGTDGQLVGTSRTLTGAVTVTAGETTVTGVGTLFLSEVVAGGYVKLGLHQDVAYTRVAKVLTNTSLVLSGGYQGASGTGSVSYEFHRFILGLNQFTLEDIGKRLTLSGSSTETNNDKYEIENLLKLSPSDPTYNGTTVALVGTITPVGTAVTGVGTAFLTSVAPGGYIKLTSDPTASYARVVTVTSNTSLTLETAYSGGSGPGSAQYTVDPSFRLVVIRRVGPSDSATAGTPIRNDAGPLNWALLPRTQLALKGRTQVVRGLVEQFGYDAMITAIGPRTGSLASITAVASGLVTMTGLTGMSLDAVGSFITISGAATAANNGVFRIAAFVSSTSVKYANSAGVFPDANSGAISWITLPPDEVEIQMPSGRFSPDLSGSFASISDKSGDSVTIQGLNGMEPSCVGQAILISGAAVSGNNSTTPFTITQYLSASSVIYTNPAGVVADANNGSISWVYNSPDREKLLTLRGPGANNGTVEVRGVSSTTNVVTVAQRVVPQIDSPALPDLPDPFTLDAGPLEWELRPRTTLIGTSESPAFQRVQVRAPSLLQYLAKDYGIDIDIRESENRQRSWVKNNGRWIGIKGHPKAYSILGDISGFNIVPEALYHITQDLSLGIPQEFLYETGEYALGRSAPNPTHSVPSDPLFRDGSLVTLLGDGGRVRFSSPTAEFKPSDVGLLVRIGNSLIPGNNKLYTIDEIPPDQPGGDGFIRAVLFRLVDTATTPDPQNGVLQWNITRLYTTQPPLRPRFDDLDPELMGQSINPSATAYVPGASSLGDILYVAKVAGTFGNGIRIQHVSTGALSVSVVGEDITVTFNAGVTTANAVAAAIAALPAANTLVTAAPQNGGTGFLFPYSFTNLAGGEDHFALDKFCWEDSFDSAIDGLLPFLAVGVTTSGNILYTAGVDGGFGVRVTHNPVALAPLSITTAEDTVTVTYDPAVTTANDVAAAILASPSASLLVKATAWAGGTGLLAPIGLTNAVLNILPSVTQVAENLWGLTISGPLNVVQDIQGGNWKLTDANSVDFFLESLPVASGSNWVTTVFSAIEPVPGPVVLTYNCVPVFSCDYCAASKVLLTLEPGTIFEDAQNALALELILNRMLGRIEQVTPAHVQTIVLFSATLSASLNLQAFVDTGITTIGTLIAPIQAYYDEIYGDMVPVDSLSLDAEVEGPYFTINVGSITGFAGVTATMSGFTGPMPNVIGQSIVISGAATPANNGTFPITGYTSGVSSTVDYTNAAAVAPDANNLSITASIIP